MRRTEIGVRIALGADRLGILVLVFRRVAVMLALGLAAGLGLSLWAWRFVGALLFRLEPRDVSTFAGALTVLSRRARSPRGSRRGGGPASIRPRSCAKADRRRFSPGRTGRQDRQLAADALAQRPARGHRR